MHSSHLMHRVVRRTLQTAQGWQAVDSVPAVGEDADAQRYWQLINDWKDLNYKMPTWGIATLVTMAVVGMMIHFMVSYLLEQVVTTLAIVETPTSSIALPVDELEKLDEPDAPLEKEPLVKEVEAVVIKNKVMTNSIRRTVGHLYRTYGTKGLFRGVRIAAFYHICYAIGVSVYTWILPTGIGSRIFARVWMATMLSRVHLAWTHEVIAEPSGKSIRQRIPDKRMFKLVGLPAAFLALTIELAVFMPVAVFYAFGLADINGEDVRDATHEQRCAWMIQLLICGATGLYTAFFLVFPAYVSLTRLEASLLPEDEQTVVPFDRSFNGSAKTFVLPEVKFRKCIPRCLLPKVTRVTEAGETISYEAKTLSFVPFFTAWKTFNWSARWRLIKLCTKIEVIQVSMMLIGFQVLFMTVQTIMGQAFGKFVLAANAALQLHLQAIRQG